MYTKKSPFKVTKKHTKRMEVRSTLIDVHFNDITFGMIESGIVFNCCNGNDVITIEEASDSFDSWEKLCLVLLGTLYNTNKAAFNSAISSGKLMNNNVLITTSEESDTIGTSGVTTRKIYGSPFYFKIRTDTEAIYNLLLCLLRYLDFDEQAFMIGIEPMYVLEETVVSKHSKKAIRVAACNENDAVNKNTIAPSNKKRASKKANERVASLAELRLTNLDTVIVKSSTFFGLKHKVENIEQAMANIADGMYEMSGQQAIDAMNKSTIAYSVGVSAVTLGAGYAEVYMNNSKLYMYHNNDRELLLAYIMLVSKSLNIPNTMIAFSIVE